MKGKGTRGRKATPSTLLESRALVTAMQATAGVLRAWHPQSAEVGMLIMALASVAGAFNGQAQPEVPAGE